MYSLLFQTREPREEDLELRFARLVDVVEVGAAIDHFPEVLGLDAQELFEATFENMDREEATRTIAPSTKRRGSRRSIPAFQS